MSQEHTSFLGSYNHDYEDLATDWREELAAGVTPEMALPVVIYHIYRRHLGCGESIPWIAVGQLHPRSTVGRVAQIFVKQYWKNYEKR